MNLKKLNAASGVICNAFTLAELLMAVLVISIIMVALAPVITKRVTDNLTLSSGVTKDGRLFLYDETDPACKKAADGSNTLECEFEVPLDVQRVSVIMVSGGGGGGGASTPTTLYNQKKTVANATIGEAAQEYIPITKGMKNVKISYLTGAGGGGGGGAYAKTDGGTPQSQEDCNPYNAMFIPAAYNGSGGKNTCVTKYNVGDANGPSIPSSVKAVAAGRTCSDAKCCWQGTTSNYCSDNWSDSSHSTNYSGCNRTVCTWHAASDACAAWSPAGTNTGDWRLPAENEMSGWKDHTDSVTTYLGSDGLQLCDSDSRSTGSAYCDFRYRGCPSSSNINNSCYPSEVWSAATSGSGTYYHYYLYSDSFLGPSSESANSALSARCVLEKFSERYNSYGGGGGGGAPYLKNYTIPQDVIDANVGGKIRMYAAGGGSGGAAAASAGTNASSGSAGIRSYIYVVDAANQIKWGYITTGGNGGRYAKSNAFGAGAAQKAANTCQINENGTSWVYTNCSGYGPNGTDGTALTNISATDAATGGTGGGSAYNYYSYTGGGPGGNSSNEAGYAGTNYGAGGGGGTVRIYVSGSTVTTYNGAGGKGANGVAEITYDMVYPAAAGGGGGGGAFAKVTDLAVVPEKKYTVRVGGGGSGGGVSNNGGAGGTSAVTFGSSTYSLSGGGNGGLGVAANSASAAVHGAGGTKGIVSTNVSNKNNLEFKNGYDGEAGSTRNMTSGSRAFIVSAGGIGGKSGINSEGGCGGLFIDTAICTNTDANGVTMEFVKPKDLYKAAQYGKAGSGGGGGGWSEDTASYPNPGGGGVGQNGYVYIYWTKN